MKYPNLAISRLKENDRVRKSFSLLSRFERLADVKKLEDIAFIVADGRNYERWARKNAPRNVSWPAIRAMAMALSAYDHGKGTMEHKLALHEMVRHLSYLRPFEVVLVFVALKRGKGGIEAMKAHKALLVS